MWICVRPHIHASLDTTGRRTESGFHMHLANNEPMIHVGRYGSRRTTMDTDIKQVRNLPDNQHDNNNHSDTTLGTSQMHMISMPMCDVIIHNSCKIMLLLSDIHN